MEVKEAMAPAGARSMGVELADAVVILRNPIQRVKRVTASQVWVTKAAVTTRIVAPVSPVTIIPLREAVRLTPRRIR